MSADTVSRIRSFNRFYTNVLGLLDRGILGSSYSLTEVRLMLEIDRMERCTFARLAALLNMDGGQLSRTVRRLVSAGIVGRERSAGDGRVEYLELTEAGRREFLELDGKSNGQIESLIGHLSADERAKLTESMEFVEKCLAGGGGGIQIRPYVPEDITYVIGRHRELYRRDYGFKDVFGDYVEKTVRAFHAGREEGREQMWIAWAGDVPAGAAAVVQASDKEAQFRWFFVEPEARGRGVGGALIATVLGFCREKGYRKVILWTADVLKVARRMYEANGFRLVEAKPNDTWTDGVLNEEKWELAL